MIKINIINVHNFYIIFQFGISNNLSVVHICNLKTFGKRSLEGFHIFIVGHGFEFEKVLLAVATNLILIFHLRLVDNYVLS